MEVLAMNWFAGLAISLVLGYLIITFFVGRMRKGTEDEKYKDKAMAFWTGTIERLFFTLLVAFEMSGIPTVMVAWVIFKVAPDWERLTKETVKEDQKGPAFIRLLGNVLSMIFALIGGLICNEEIPLLKLFCHS
jgi:hypothetical protein